MTIHIQKMKAGKDLYLSTNLLDQGEGINGLTNVKTLIKEYGTSVKRVFQSNIRLEDENYYLEEFNQNKNPTIIVEEDMFGKEKIWIQNGGIAEHLLNTIENNTVLDEKLKNEIISETFKNFYVTNQLESKILNEFTLEDKNLIRGHIEKDQILKKFIAAFKSSGGQFNIDNGECQIYLKTIDLKNIVDTIKQDLNSVLKTKKLLLVKSEDASKPSIRRKQKLS